jgi:hypothetical protein
VWWRKPEYKKKQQTKDEKKKVTDKLHHVKPHTNIDYTSPCAEI